MPSYQITISPSERAAARFVNQVRRALQRALAEENKERGVTQSDVARTIGVNRSVISREFRGHMDLSLSRVAEIAWALGRKPSFDLPKRSHAVGSNLPPQPVPAAEGTNNPLVIEPPTDQAGASNDSTSFSQAA